MKPKMRINLKPEFPTPTLPKPKMINSNHPNIKKLARKINRAS